MTCRTILKWPDNRLLKVSKPIDKDSFGKEEVLQLAHDLEDTMIANHGLGLASSQINIFKNACVIDVSSIPELPKDPHLKQSVFLGNPVVNIITNDEFSWREACLSIDDLDALVIRYKEIEIIYNDTNGNQHMFHLSGANAGVIQHEVDHLLGKLFIHRLRGATRLMVTKKLNKRLLRKRRSKP